MEGPKPHAICTPLPPLQVTTQDPVKNRWWDCTGGASDAACQAALAAGDEGSFCLLAPEQWTWTHPSWSLVSQFDLTCERRFLVHTATAIFFAGALVGSGIFGVASDTWGRKRPLAAATMLLAAATFASLTAPNFATYVALRTVAGCGASGQSVAIFLLATENVGPSWRGSAQVLSLVVWCIAEFVLIGAAALLRPWRHYTLLSACLASGALLLVPWLPESARWLLARGRGGEAAAVLERIARMNGTSMPPHPLACAAAAAATVTPASARQPLLPQLAAPAQPDCATPMAVLLQLLRCGAMVGQLVVVGLAAYTGVLAYYGLAFGSGSLKGSM